MLYDIVPSLTKSSWFTVAIVIAKVWIIFCPPVATKHQIMSTMWKRNTSTIRVQINDSHFAICDAFLRFCEANFIQKYKNTKLTKSVESSQRIVGKITEDTQSSNMHFDC